MFSIYEVLPQILELWGQNMMVEVQAKKSWQEYKGSRSTREMTTPLFLLRCVELGIAISDLDLLTIGLVIDMWTEKGNDDVKYKKVVREANQEDFDAF